MAESVKRIKIIKRAERDETRARLASEGRHVAPHSPAQAKRQEVAVIAGWVGEWRRKKDEEAARGFAALFSRQAKEAADVLSAA